MRITYKYNIQNKNSIIIFKFKQNLEIIISSFGGIKIINNFRLKKV